MSSRSVATPLPRAGLRSRDRALIQILILRLQRNVRFPSPTGRTALFGNAQILVRASELVVKRDKPGAERAGQPRVACIVKR